MAKANHRRPPQFSGVGDEYDLWETRFTAHLSVLSLKKSLTPPNAPSDDDAIANEQIYCELVQALDSKSLALIMYEAVDNGRKALEILRNHYRGSGRPRIMHSYTKLCNLTMQNETLTEFMIRAEGIAAGLRAAGETVSDSLIISMIMKGLPERYATFCTFVTQSDKEYSLPEFKAAIMNHDSTTTSVDDLSSASAMFAKGNQSSKSASTTGGSRGRSGGNRKTGTEKRFCNYCKRAGHIEEKCFKKKNDRRQTKVNKVEDQDDHGSGSDFVFYISSDVSAKCKETSSPASIMVDTGATAHIICDESLVTRNSGPVDHSHTIELANGERVTGIVKSRVDAMLVVKDSTGKQRKITLQNTLFIPDFKMNILSVSKLIEKKGRATFAESSSFLEMSNGVRLPLNPSGKLFFLPTIAQDEVKTVKSLQEWHEVFGHMNQQDLKKMPSHVSGMKIRDPHSTLDCYTCAAGKMTHAPVPKKRENRAQQPLELVHCDLAGPISPSSSTGKRFAICFTDDFSGVKFAYFLTDKSSASAALQQFLADTAPYGTVKTIRSDNGGEFLGKFKDILKDNRIAHQTSSPYTPQQNGVAERGWRTLFATARCNLIDSNLPKYLWTHAVAHAAYTRNRTYQQRTGCTPYELFTGHKPKVDKMVAFGTPCHVLNESVKDKLSPRSQPGIFIGYSKLSPTYQIYLKNSHKICESRNVRFHALQTDDGDDMSLPDEDKPATDDSRATTPEEPQALVSKEPSAVTPQNRPRRDTRPPKFLEDYVVSAAQEVVDLCYRISVPHSYEEAMRSPDAQCWKNAMDEEIHALHENDTWDLEVLPPNVKPVGGKWVYSVKTDQNGDLDRYKARFVAQGCGQVQGLNYAETFSPTVRMTTVRLLMQYSVDHSWSLYHFDVKTAFLHANIDFDVYVTQPKGYEKFDENGNLLFCHLNKSLYGLKQSGRLWNKLLHDFLTENGFIQSSSEHCLYTLTIDSHVVKLVIFVDDLILASDEDECANKVKSLLMSRFHMKDLGSLKWFLGISFDCKSDVIEMNQSQYVKQLLQKHNMEKCKPSPTPFAGKLDFNDETDEISPVSIDIYQSIVGSLVYLSCSTRPDLTFIVHKLAQYMSKPVTVPRWNAIKRIFRYLKGTMHYSLSFTKSGGEIGMRGIKGFCDADWAGAKNDRKSVSGFCFALSNTDDFDDCFGLVSWCTRKQSVVALSTCESEYISIASAVQEGLYLKQLLCDLDPTMSTPKITLFSDNQSAISLAHNPVNHKRSKHFDIRYHFIRDHIQKDDVVLSYCPSEQMIADFLTKPLTKQPFQRICSQIFV